MDPVKKQPVSVIKQELLGSLVSEELVKKLMDQYSSRKNNLKRYTKKKAGYKRSKGSG